MGAVKEMWMDKQEELFEQFEMGEISRDEFIAEMRALGYRPHEVEEMIADLDLSHLDED
jgi:hypothetical protein